MRIRSSSSILPALALGLALSACGQNTDKTPANAVSGDDGSSAVAPADNGMRGARRGPQTLASMQNRASASFDRLDVDKDGVVTTAELEAASSEGGRGGRMLARADADSDGRITCGEASASAAERFARMDADGDSAISEEERPQRRRRGGGGEG